MAAKKVKVTYNDKREVVVKVPPRAQVMTEEYCGGITAQKGILATYHLGWAALKVTGQESQDFDAWLDQIDDVEDVEDDKPTEDPTQPAQSDDASSD